MKLNIKIIKPTAFIGFYMIYFFYLTKYLYNNDLLIKLNSLTILNLTNKLLYDFFSNLFIVIIIISSTLIKRESLDTLGITKNNYKIIFILLSIYIGMFFIKADFTLIGIYKCFFYLFVVALSEELIFRGYLFTKLDNELPTQFAIIISGIMWGSMHAFIPIILNGYPFIKSLNIILSEFGGGILFGGIFILIYKKSKSLIVPIMIHAILDFASIFL